MRRVAVGVIGTGFWGENQVRVFRQSRMADLVAICDADKKRAKEIGIKYGVPWFSDLSKFLRVPNLEAVTVCTPSFIERFNPGVRAVKKMLMQRVVGDVIIATGRRVARWPIRIGDVGVVKDTAIHDIDAMRYLLEEEVSAVFAQTGSLRTHSYEDYAEIMLRFDEGTTGFLDANWLTPRKVRTLIITGSEATISLDYITQEITLESSQRLVKPFAPWAEPLKLELENFITTIVRDREEAPSGEDALKAIRVCDAALRSGKSKTLVTLNTS
ncbi:Gfo/Idh/MocA family oxidoreductase [Candidatus Bathyarchaeota archaeon]|nr:MAG: Gfo/Idh/MocA family oxidoreductase [Candidatus Bathyarchaeota archaeon]